MKKLLVVALTAALLVTGASCQKKEKCFFCGEEKVCKEMQFWDEVVNICEDCTAELSYDD